MDALSTDTCVCRLAALLECSVTMELAMDRIETFGFMHTSSCDSMLSWHRLRRACDVSLERY